MCGCKTTNDKEKHIWTLFFFKIEFLIDIFSSIFLLKWCCFFRLGHFMGRTFMSLLCYHKRSCFKQRHKIVQFYKIPLIIINENKFLYAKVKTLVFLPLKILFDLKWFFFPIHMSNPRAHLLTNVLINFLLAFTWAMKKTGGFMGNATTPMVTDTTTKVSVASRLDRVEVVPHMSLVSSSTLLFVFCLQWRWLCVERYASP